MHRYYTLREATTLLGYGNVNTVRNQHLEPKGVLARHYLNGHLCLERAAVDALVAELADKRRARPQNWRILNLGEYAGSRRPRRRRVRAQK